MMNVNTSQSPLLSARRAPSAGARPWFIIMLLAFGALVPALLFVFGGSGSKTTPVDSPVNRHNSSEEPVSGPPATEAHGDPGATPESLHHSENSSAGFSEITSGVIQKLPRAAGNQGREPS